MDEYAASGRKGIAFSSSDQSGRSISGLRHRRRSSPVHYFDSRRFPAFPPDGEIVFRAIEGGSNLSIAKADGSGVGKSLRNELDAFSVSRMVI
jgi:hypothetical protein